MSETVRTDLPRGFAGVVDGWHDIVPDRGARELRLPRDAEADGPFLRVPEGEFDTIFVESFCEGLGSFEEFIATLVTRLAAGGRLYFDALHEQSPRNLRVTLEGRPNSLDPLGSFRRHEVGLSAGRLIDGVSATGILVDDVLRLPHPDSTDSGFVRTMIGEGIMAAEYAGGAPAARLWLCASRQPLTSGTVVIGPGDGQDETLALVEAFLPADWNIVASSEDQPEPTAFNRAVPATTGESLWFLRAGSRPTRELFDDLWANSVLQPSLPGDERGPNTPGDLSGLMIARRELLRAGPIDDTWKSPTVAYEDFGMRFDSIALHLTGVGGALEMPPPDIGELESVEREFGELVDRWEGVGQPDDLVAPGANARARTAREIAPPPWQGREPKVTLCMIARDEERFLDECLRRAAPAVDEIVVVDTGSTDRTIEIARSHGARVIEEAWCDDFAHSRNTSLEAATGDWILVLDADEFLDDGAVEALRRAVANPEACGYHIRFTNVYDDKKTLGVTMVRLFRKLPGITWQNRIHEQITPSLLTAAYEQGLLLSSADVHVLHYGYTGEIMDSRNKLERNERLFERQLEENPEDVYSLYKYGDFLRRVPGRDRDARDVLERTLELILEGQPGCPRGIPYASEVAALCALEFARDEDFDRAEDIVETALRRFLVTPNLHYIAAGIALRRGREAEAIEHYRRCLRYRGQTLVVPIQEGITGHVSLTGMAQAYLQLGDRERARRLLEQALAIDPSHDVTAMVLSRLWLEQGDAQRAVRVLNEYVAKHPNSAGASQQLALLLGQLGLKDQALRMGERAIELLEADASEIEANQMRTKLAALT